jgi:hypothetical protein
LYRGKKRKLRNPVYVFFKNENEIKINVWDKIELLADDQPEKQAKKILRDAKSFLFVFK